MSQWRALARLLACGAHKRAGCVPKFDLSRRAPPFWDIPMIRFFRSRSDGSFKARSLDRDSNADGNAVKIVADAINLVLGQAEAERVGLQKRMDEVIARAAVVGGNDADDFVTRSEDRSEMLKKSDADIKRGQARLSAIDNNISHFRFLKTALQSRFPDSKL